MQMEESLSNRPLWLDAIQEQGESAADLPDRVDVLVVGSGYTGLNAALETVRAGRSTLVIDAAEPGAGCSTRNGGQISTSIKPSLAELTRRHGRERALAMRQTGVDALEWIESRVAETGVDCHFQRNGLLRAAHTPQHYRAMLRDLPFLADESIEAVPLPRAQMHQELGTDRYHGALVFPQHASLHPGLYHQALMRTVSAAGAQIMGQCAATAIERQQDASFRVQTVRGLVHARNVVIATNGYSGSLVPWLQKRVIPIGSYVMCTEELPEALMNRLFPTSRHVTDTCKVVYYYRTSPDRRRVIFGGRVSAGETDVRVSALRLRRHMCRLFPELAPYRITHSWSGKVAYSFDELVHTGCHEGLHYAMGYCGSGVSMASYMGMKLGLKVLQQAQGQTPFDDLPYPTRPLYAGKPWFLPPVVAWYRLRDHWQWSRHA